MANEVIGTAAMVIGSLSLITALLCGVAHYVYGVQIYRRHTHVPASPGLIALFVIAFGVGGVVAICGGWYLWRQRAWDRG